MAEVFTITDICDERVQLFTALTDNKLRRHHGVFIAESPKVIHAALDCGLKPRSLLCEQRHIVGDAADVLSRCPSDIPVYTGTREVLQNITGYSLTRGVLCAMERPAELPVADVVTPDARRLAIIDGVCDTTNIGSIFRAAAALGIDGVLLTRGSCDPLNRRSIRVSMGTVFRVPWTWIDNPHQVKELGVKTVALALHNNSVTIDSPVLAAEPRLAIILGTEGDGLADPVIDGADYSAIIPMHRGVDSLNVASAAALAFWQLRICADAVTASDGR